MFTEWLRKVSKGIIQPIARLLGRLGISPNALTIVGCLLNLGISVLIGMGYLRLGGFLLIPAFAFDALDGTVAREMNRVTKFGAFLDSCLDRISESAVLLALAWWYLSRGSQTEVILAIISIIGASMVSYTRARAETIEVDCKVGLFTRVERGLLIIAGLIVGLSSLMLWVMAIGTMATAVQRMAFVYIQSRKVTSQ
ncbi:MAG: CDP-alcohol phosphatidyltransferase family protein [Anaerolineae bacterium]